MKTRSYDRGNLNLLISEHSMYCLQSVIIVRKQTYSSRCLVSVQLETPRILKTDLCIRRLVGFVLAPSFLSAWRDMF